MSKSKKNEPTGPLSKTAELYHHLDILDKVLAPELLSGIKKLFYEACQDIEQRAKDERMSQEMQQLEPLLKQFAYGLQQYGQDVAGRYLWRMRPVIRKILELYVKKTETT